MKNNFVFLVIILVAAMIVSLPLYYFSSDSKNEASVSLMPQEIGRWKGKDLEVEERVYEILETRNLIMREYESNSGEKIYLYIVYSQDNRKVSHPPELCMEGEGMTVRGKELVKIKMPTGSEITANKIIVEKGNIRNLVVYWYKAGSSYMTDYIKQQIKVSLDRLRFKRTCSALIRVSAVLLNKEDERNKLAIIKEFCQQLYPYLDKIIP